MSRIVWTLFGITLTVLVTLGAGALGLIPGPMGPGGAPSVVIAMDGTASVLEGKLLKVLAERDRLVGDLAALEADRKAVMEDLALVVGEREQLRALLENAEQRIELLAKAVPEETRNPVSAPVETVPLDAPNQAANVGAAFKSQDEGAPAAAPSGGTLVPEAGRPEAAIPEPAGTQLANANPAQALARGLRAYREAHYRLAFYTWLPLAHGGDPRAQFYVGGLYTEGRGVPANKTMAYVWLRRSMQGGYHRAQPLLERLAEAMTPAEMHAAETNVAK